MRADSSPDKMSDNGGYRLLRQLTIPRFMHQGAMPQQPRAAGRSLKKSTLKKSEFPPTHEPISRNTPRPAQFLQRGKTHGRPAPAPTTVS